MPRFSVIIPCFNAETTIGQTLSSLCAQTCQDWEAICIDDGSTDRTCDRIAAWAAQDHRITLARNPRQGPSAARNVGAMELARGEIIAFCDADDIWTADKLADLAQVFTVPHVDGVFGEIAFFSTRPGDTAVRSTAPSRPLDVEMLMGENPVCTMSNIAVRRARICASGGFDESFLHNEDLDWLIRLVADGAHIIGLPRLHVYYRRSANGLSADLEAMEHGRRMALRSAARRGFHPSGRAHATHCRYLARRALRLGHARPAALRHALSGIAHSPAGFLLPVKRGLPTLAAALCALALPRRVTRRLFA